MYTRRGLQAVRLGGFGLKWPWKGARGATFIASVRLTSQSQTRPTLSQSPFRGARRGTRSWHKAPRLEGTEETMSDESQPCVCQKYRSWDRPQTKPSTSPWKHLALQPAALEERLDISSIFTCRTLSLHAWFWCWHYISQQSVTLSRVHVSLHSPFVLLAPSQLQLHAS